VLNSMAASWFVNPAKVALFFLLYLYLHLELIFFKILSDYGVLFTSFVLLGFVAVAFQSLNRNYRLAGSLALVILIAGI